MFHFNSVPLFVVKVQFIRQYQVIYQVLYREKYYNHKVLCDCGIISIMCRVQKPPTPHHTAHTAHSI